MISDRLCDTEVMAAENEALQIIGNFFSPKYILETTDAIGKC